MNASLSFGVALLVSVSVTTIVFANERSAPLSLESQSNAQWELIWEEDFSGTQLDEKTWSLVERGKSAWHDTMSNDARLLQVRDGVLRLRGIVNDNQAQDPSPYLTAGVTSKDKFSFRYGKVQIRARFDSAQGAWPALWMLGSDRKKWPEKGEIDLMEHLNFEQIIYQTVHSEYTVKIDQQNSPIKGATSPIQRDDWNTYGCEWDANKIVFTVNGQVSHTYPRAPGKGAVQWPFDQPFYFVLSMQIGGKWVNSSGPTIPAHYPVDMEVDWIRIYSQEQPITAGFELLP